MEPTGPLSQLFAMFGVDVGVVATVATLVFFLTELIKNKLGPKIMFGYRVDLLAFCLAFGLTYKAIQPVTLEQWSGVALSAIVCWALPAGAHGKLKAIRGTK